MYGQYFQKKGELLINRLFVMIHWLQNRSTAHNKEAANLTNLNSKQHMISRLTFFSFSIFILATQVACQNPSSQTSSTRQSDTTKFATDNFFKQVMLLDEFKQEQKRVDSIKKVSGIPVKVSVDIVDSSFLQEDKGKNISLAFINEQYPYDNRIIYTIKFDKGQQKIISINKDKKQFEKSDLAKPEDIVLPNKNN